MQFRENRWEIRRTQNSYEHIVIAAQKPAVHPRLDGWVAGEYLPRPEFPIEAFKEVLASASLAGRQDDRWGLAQIRDDLLSQDLTAWDFKSAGRDPSYVYAGGWHNSAYHSRFISENLD